MAFSINELDAESAAVLPSRTTMRRGDNGGGILNGNLNTSSGDIFVGAFNGSEANVHGGAFNWNTAASAQSISIGGSTSGGIYVALPTIG